MPPQMYSEDVFYILLDRTRPAGGPHIRHLLSVSSALPNNIITLTVGFKLNVIYPEFRLLLQ